MNEDHPSPCRVPCSSAVIAIIGAAAAIGCWLAMGWDLPRVGLPSEALPEFPARAIGALCITLITALALIAAGRGILTAFIPDDTPPALALALSFLTGAAVVGTIGSYVAFVAIFPGMVFVLSLPFCFLLRSRHLRLPAPRSPENWATLALVLLVFLAALVPAVESDGLRYHLTTAQEWQRAGRFVLLPFSANSNLPAMQSLLAAMISHGSDLGRVYQLLHATHLAALVVLAGAVASTILRAAGDDQILARYAPFLVASVPVIALVGSWPFSDVASVAYLLAAIVVTMPGVARNDGRAIAAASLLLGASVAVKLSMLPLSGLIGLWILGRVLIGPELARKFAFLLLPGLLVLAPWLAKSMVYHGNPVYPLAYGIFGGEEWSEANAEFYQSKVREKGLGRDVASMGRSLWDVTVNWQDFEGHNPGPALIGLLPAAIIALAVRRRMFNSHLLPFLLLLVPGWFVWFHSYQSVRFLMPQIVAAIVLGCVGFSVIPVRLKHVARAVLLLLAVCGAAWTVYYQLAIVPVYQAALGRIDEDLYISRRFNGYSGVMWLRDNTEKDEPVFYIGEHRGMYAHPYRPILSDWFDTPRILTEIRATTSNDELLARWREQGIRYVLLNQAELGMYEQLYFQPRFSAAEWERFDALRRDLARNVAFESGSGVYVLRVDE